VEFALVAPLLLLLILGLTDFARAWNVFQVITDAAREGARQAVIESTPALTAADVEAIIEAALVRANLDPANATIEIDGIDDVRGEPTTVTIAYEYRLGWVGAIMAFTQGSDQLTLTTEIVMRNE
jgi:Flp pilus assembly protein TadG